MTSQTHTINSVKAFHEYMNWLFTEFEQHKYIEVSSKVGKGRTCLQNNALHLWLSQMSIALNEAGYDMKLVLKHHPSIPWDYRGINFKERVWRPTQEALTQEKSSTKLSTTEVPYTYEVLAKHFSENFNVHVPWPSKESM